MKRLNVIEYMRATAHTTGSSFKIYPKLLYMLHIRSHSISLFARQLITDFTIQHHYIHISYSVQLHIAAVRCLICFVHSIYLLGSVFVLVYKYTSHTVAVVYISFPTCDCEQCLFIASNKILFPFWRCWLVSCSRSPLIENIRFVRARESSRSARNTATVSKWREEYT